VSRDIIKTLNNLIHLDQDAIRAYDEAIARRQLVLPADDNYIAPS
jgi:hypothetical protein